MKEETTPAGGLFYFFAVICVVPASIVIARLSLELVFSLPFSKSLIFPAALVIGIILSSLFRGHWATFLHELKHSVAANLAGNRYKAMKVDEQEGAFTYSYTKATAHLNAFIALAPYCFPLFSAVGLLVSLLFQPGSWERVAVVAVPLGLDLALGWRDIGPWQTDFSRLRGGFKLGVIYVFGLQLLVTMLLLIWALMGLQGLLALGHKLLELALIVVQLLRSGN